jgi:tripartite-type tricarboxylate transporter receptor subunit TctC
MRNFVFMMASALVGIYSVNSVAKADQYPSKPITVIVGYSAGGGTDTYARILASVIPEYINNQAFIVVNKPGGAQVPAMKTTANAKPDGYTIQLFSTGSVVAATMLRPRGVDYFEDLTPIAQSGNINLSIVAHKDTGISTPKELAAAIKKSHAAGKKMRWAHTGRGSTTNLAAIGWLIKNGVYDMVQDVPFKGGSPTRAAVLGKQVDFGAMGLQQTTGFMDKLNIIGISALERDPIRKDAKTFKEQNSPFLEMYSPVTLAAPKGTPKSAIDTLSAAIKKATAHKAYRKLTKKAGLAAMYKGPEGTLKLMKGLRDQWVPTIDFVKKRMAK